MRSLSFSSVRRLAASGSGLIVGFVWGVAEALLWPIIPDYYVFAIVPSVPSRWWRVAVVTSAGSVIGGSIGFWWAYARADAFPLEVMPLVTTGMVDQAQAWLTGLGPLGVINQPLSGVPYKVFVYLAGSSRMSFFVFLWASVLARSTRIFAVALLAAGLGRLAGESWSSRLYDVFLFLFTVVFAYGLWRAVQTYS